MKLGLLSLLKHICWLSVSILTSFFSVVLCIGTFGWSEYPLGNNIFIYAMFSKKPYYDVYYKSCDKKLGYVVPTKYSNAFDSITGKRLESVRRIKRYPDYLTIITHNARDGKWKYYVLKKDFDPHKVSEAQIRVRYLAEITDSTIIANLNK